MIEAFAAAGFTKLHLDTSMGCEGEPAALTDEATAGRAARLAERAEATAAACGGVPPVYVIGTEVPIPRRRAGGPRPRRGDRGRCRPEAHHRRPPSHVCRSRAGGRLRARYRRRRPTGRRIRQRHRRHGLSTWDGRERCQCVAGGPRRLVFEAHSTDYQPRQALRALVEDGFAILKVGPALTFALREALYGLSGIADILAPAPDREALPDVMERVMLEAPDNWRKYYPGNEVERALLRHYSFSDRIRYYWPDPRAPPRSIASSAARRPRHSAAPDQPVSFPSPSLRPRRYGLAPAARPLPRCRRGGSEPVLCRDRRERDLTNGSRDRRPDQGTSRRRHPLRSGQRDAKAGDRFPSRGPCPGDGWRGSHCMPQGVRRSDQV